MGYPVEKAEVDQPEGPIRETGEYSVGLILHADVITDLKIVVVGEETTG